MISELISSFTMQVDRKKEEMCQVLHFVLSTAIEKFLEIPNYMMNPKSMIGDASALA